MKKIFIFLLCLVNFAILFSTAACEKNDSNESVARTPYDFLTQYMSTYGKYNGDAYEFVISGNDKSVSYTYYRNDFVQIRYTENTYYGSVYVNINISNSNGTYSAELLSGSGIIKGKITAGDFKADGGGLYISSNSFSSNKSTWEKVFRGTLNDLIEAFATFLSSQVKNVSIREFGFQYY